MKWLPDACENDVFSLEVRKKLKRLNIKLTYKNKPLNPFAKDENKDELLDKPFSQVLLENLEIMPTWQYRDDNNVVVFDIKLGGGNSANVFNSLIEMILNIVPQNIVEPFQTGNTLQILFMGICVGVAMIILKDRVDIIGKFVEQANSLITLILSWIGSLMPFFIFLSVVRLMLQGTLTQNSENLFLPVGVCIMVMIIEMLIECLTMLKYKLSPVNILKKLSTHTLICLSTASSPAGFSAMVRCCDKNMGIKKKVSDFALPFGTIFFKPDMVIQLTHTADKLSMLDKKILTK